MISPFFSNGKVFHCHSLQAKQLHAAIQSLVLFLPEQIIVFFLDKKGSYLLQLKSKNTAAILSGFSLILRCFFFVPPGAPEAPLWSRNGQTGPHHGNCVHQECLSVPAVMLRLCFCNFSSFQPMGVVRQEAIGRKFRGVFRLNLINHDRVIHCCKKQSKTKNEKHPVSSFLRRDRGSVAPSRGPEEVGASSTLTSLSRR